MKGLKQLVQMRGGLPAFRSNPFLYRQLTWLDLQASIRLQERPRFQPTGLIENDLLAHSPFLVPAISHFNPAVKPNLPSISTSGSSDPYDELIQVYQGLCFLSTLKTLASSSTDVLFLDKLYFSDKVAIVERRAQFLKYTESEADIHLLRAFSEASLIFIYSVLRDFPDGNAMHLDLQQQLRASLSNIPLSTMAESSLALVLWMLLVGCTVDQASETGSWFVAKLADLAREFGLQPVKEELLAAIDGFPWGNCTVANGNAAMWRELNRFRESDENP